MSSATPRPRFLLRRATPEDAAAIAAIQAHWVTHSAIIFDVDPPSVSDIAEAIARLGARHPWIVLEEEGRVLGHAHTNPFKEKAAYDWATETTIYLAPEARGNGYGRVLHEAMRQAALICGFVSLNACIAAPPLDADGMSVPDPYLTDASIRFHERLGYRMVGRFTSCGHKFGRWYDMVWMELHLGPVPPAPLPTRSVAEASGDIDAALQALSAAH